MAWRRPDVRNIERAGEALSLLSYAFLISEDTERNLIGCGFAWLEQKVVQ